MTAEECSGCDEILTTTDADLVPRCRAGDEVAWRELVTRHTRKVFGLAYRFTGRVDEAEDLTQEVFVKVYQTLGRYRESEGPFGAGSWPWPATTSSTTTGGPTGAAPARDRPRRPRVHPGAPGAPVAGLERESASASSTAGCVPCPSTCGCRSSCATSRGCRTRTSRASSGSPRDGEEPDQPRPARAGEAPPGAPPPARGRRVVVKG